jgi:NAD+ synthase (glutamine-hydrolysing)
LNPQLRIALAQTNLIVGDFAYNRQKILTTLKKAHQNQVDLIVFPELTITGYPAQDLILNQQFIAKNRQCLDKIANNMPKGIVALIGFIESETDQLFNSVAVLQNRNIVAIRRKTLLPNYDVFDEKRYFTSAKSNSPVLVQIHDKTVRLGLQICEDLWDTNSPIKLTHHLVEQGCDLLINISASPFEFDKRETREKLVSAKVQEFTKPFILVNLVGGQDELVFDGNSFAMDCHGNYIGHCKSFQEDLEIFNLDLTTMTGPIKTRKPMQREEAIYQALLLGIHDYFNKSGFKTAVLGVSGGVDSAVVACLATAALGPENVICISMPSRYTADISNADAESLTRNLRTQHLKIPIEALAAQYEQLLTPLFQNQPKDITEENIQSRIRGNLLMAIANKNRAFVLNTGNKTELALGYCTLYGDMAGALAVISDLSKKDVYALADYINLRASIELIPKRILKRIPTAELKTNQVDPFDYEIISPLVDQMINAQKSAEQLIAEGYGKNLVLEVARMIRLAEFKRRQAAPGLKISRKAFGIGRRFPIINRFQEDQE